jgi:hypothetical protein
MKPKHRNRWPWNGVKGITHDMRLVLRGFAECKDDRGAKKLVGNRCAWVQVMR